MRAGEISSETDSPGELKVFPLGGGRVGGGGGGWLDALRECLHSL